MREHAELDLGDDRDCRGVQQIGDLSGPTNAAPISTSRSVSTTKLVVPRSPRS